MPQMTACPRVERDDVAVANRTEDEIARCREYAIRAGALIDLEIPPGVAGFRIKRLDSRRRGRLARLRLARRRPRRGSPDVLTPGFVGYRAADVLLPVFGVRQVEPSSLRAVRRG